MRKIKYFLLFTFYFLLFINCSNQPPKIEFLKNDNYSNIFVIDNYKDNEQCIKYIFDFSKNNRGYLDILTDKNIFKIEDGALVEIDKTKQRFSFNRIGQSFKNKYIKVNFLKNIPVHFIIKETDNQTKLTADFKTLTVNMVQNFLDYAEKDETKKETETYTYILYNKNKVEKMKLIYHEYGAWFEVEIL